MKRYFSSNIFAVCIEKYFFGEHSSTNVYVLKRFLKCNSNILMEKYCYIKILLYQNFAILLTKIAHVT
jgi:hypothetical protein